MRYLVLMTLRDEFQHRHIKNAQTLRVTLLAAAAHKLLSQADTQNGLLKIFDYAVKIVGTEILHSGACFTYTGKNHLISTPQLLFIISQQRFNAKTFQRTQDRLYVSGIVFDYCNVHKYRYPFSAANLLKN